MAFLFTLSIWGAQAVRDMYAAVLETVQDNDDFQNNPRSRLPPVPAFTPPLLETYSEPQASCRGGPKLHRTSFSRQRASSDEGSDQVGDPLTMVLAFLKQRPSI